MKNISPRHLWAVGWLAVVLPLASLAQPTVTGRAPVRNAPSAPRSTNVVLTFSQAMNAATDQNVRVFSAQRGGRKVGAYSTVGNTITFNPSTDFRPGEKIQVVVPPSVTSGGGQAAAKQVHEFWAAATGGSGAFTAAPLTATKGAYVDIGDVTGDGRPDIVSYHNFLGLVIVRPGNGAGSFGAAINTSVSQFVATGALGDLDGDGDLDLQLTVYGSPNDYAQTFYNNGTGTFTPGSSVNLTSGTQVFHSEPVLGDIDGDGDLDMLCSYYGLMYGTDVRFNDGTGVFSGGTSFNNGQSYTTSLADMDNDGDLDVLQVAYDTQAYTMRRNNGNGAFGAPINVGTFVGDYSQLEVADMNGDGTPDLVTSRSVDFNDPAWVEVRLNDGTGICTLTSSLLTQYEVSSSLKAGDFDGDGDLDMVLAGDKQVQMLLNRGNGTLAPGPISSFANTGLDAFVSLLVADLDSDNDLDIYALANSGPGPGAAILLNQAPITVTNVYPARNLRAAPRAANEVVTFSANVLASTADNIRVFGAQAGGKKAGAYSAATNTITFNPTTDFRPGEPVSVSIPQTVKSATGGRAVKPYVYQFMGAATGGTGTFGPAIESAGIDAPYALALADLNHDGHLDALGTDRIAGTVSVSFGTGTGSFTAGSTVSVGSDPTHVVAADIDSDGDLDMLVVNSSGGKGLTVRFNNGAGVFSGGATIVMPNNPSRLAVGDVDGDGDLDALVASQGADNVTICANDGAGVFTSIGTVAVGDLAADIVVGDVDGDGDLDLLTANALSNNVSVRLNNGAGVFAPGSTVSIGSAPSQLVLGDLDGDGDLDFLSANILANTLSVRFNNGAGTFSGVTNLAVGQLPNEVVLGDVDGDGDLDFVLNDQNVTLGRNNGAGGFTLQALGNAIPYGLAMGDLDGDGDLDLAGRNVGGNLLAARLNQDAFQVSSVTPTRNAAAASRGADVAVTFNKNVNSGTSNRIRVWGQMRGGKKAGAYSTAANTVTFNPTINFAPGELVNVTVPGTVVSTGGDLARKHVYQYRAAATGGLATFTDAFHATNNGSAVKAVATADVNADGNLDLLEWHQGNNEVLLHLGNGDGTFGTGTVVDTPTGLVNTLTTADLDNDGDLDLLVGDVFANQIRIRLNAGGGSFGAPALVTTTGLPYEVLTGDLDGDGDLDLLASGGNSTVRFNDGAGGFSGGGASVLPGVLALTLGDIDNDGDLDAIAANGDKAFVRFNNGSGQFSGGYTLNVSVVAANAEANKAMLGDLDGDGDLDLIVSNQGESLVAIRLNDGAGTFSGTLNLPAGANGFDAAMGDLDGDGDLDIVVANDGASSTLLLNHGDATFAAGTPVPTTTALAITLGDVDNDGDLDILNSDDDASAVQVLLNENAFTVTARTPERHANTAAVFTDIGVTLSEAVKPTTAFRFRVFGSQSGGRKGGVFSGIGTSLTLDANVDFAPGEIIQVSAPATIQSNVGNKALQPHVYQLRAAANGGTGTFSNAPDVATLPGPVDAQLADMDGDGDRDLVILDINADQISVRLNDGAANFSAGGVTATNNAPQGMTLADVDADGDLDVLTMSTSPMTLGVRLNAGNGTFAGGSDIGVPEFAVSITAGDVDGDGDLDFVTANKVANTSSIRLNNGFGVFANGGTVAVGTMPVTVALSDIDNDGDLDLLTANQDAATVSVRRNDGHGAFSGSEEVVVGATPQALLLADIDGDGDADLLTANGTANSVTVRRNTGTGTFSAATTLALGAETNDLELADIDGDGDLDLLIALLGTSAVRVGLNNGSGAFALGVSVPVGDSPQSVASGDLDGDGDLDFVTADIATTTVSVRLNSALAGPAPLIASFTPDHGVTGTVVTLTGTNFTGATNVTFDGVAAPGFVVNGSGTELTVASPPATFNGVITITTPDGSVSTATDFGVDLVITGVEAIPAGDFHHITVTPTGIASLSGPVEATAPVLVQTGGALFTGPNVLSGAGDFTLETAATLTVGHPQGLGNGGAIQLTGGLTLPVSADYGFNGGVAQVTGLNLPAEVRNLTISNPATVSLTQPTDIRQVLTVAGSGNFDLNGQALRLLSDAAGTALLANTGAGKVVGAATAQVWLNPAPNAGLGYRHMAAPTTNATVADLATPGFVPVVTPAYNTAENPLLVKPYPNVFGFDETRLPGQTDFISGYFSPANLASALSVGVGYTAYIKGGLTPDFVGPLTQTDVTRPNLTRTGATTKTGWHLLGNPFPSPIDWDLVTVPAGLNPAVSVFQSTIATNGIYLTRANGMGSLPSGIIPMGQAFFVQVDAAPVSFTFTNACRVTTFGSAAHYRPAADPRPAAHLTLRATGAPAMETDGAVVYFQEGATAAADRDFDGEKPAHNPGLPTLVSLSSVGTELAVNGLPETDLAGTIVELLLDLPAAGTYELATAQAAHLSGTDAVLLDRLTGTRYDLNQLPRLPLTARTAGEVRGRFALVFGQESGRVTSGSGLALALYPNPAHGSVRVVSATTGPVELLDATGRVVRRAAASATAETVLDLAALPAGVYVVRAGAASQRLVVTE